MMDQSGVFRASVCALATAIVTTVCAQDEAQPAAAGQAPAAAEQQVQTDKLFSPLVRVMNIQGVCEVNNPDVGQFAPAQNDKAYPLGTAFRTGLGSSAILVFSAQESVQLLASTEVIAACPDKKPEARIVRLVSGKIKTSLRDTLSEGCFGIETPNASCKNLAGRGEYTLTTEDNTETFQAGTITGSARIVGPQYEIPALRAANTANIQTAADHSFSRLTSVSGDFATILQKGAEEPVNFAMSPKAVIKIWRENAPVGGRAIISTLVVSPTGIARHRFAYAEGRPNLATGELIEPVADEKMEDLPVLLSTPAKKDEAAAETTEKKDEPPAENKDVQ